MCIIIFTAIVTFLPCLAMIDHTLSIMPDGGSLPRIAEATVFGVVTFPIAFSFYEIKIQEAERAGMQ